MEAWAQPWLKAALLRRKYPPLPGAEALQCPELAASGTGVSCLQTLPHLQSAREASGTAGPPGRGGIP